MLATAALHAESARDMATRRLSGPPEQRVFGSMAALVDGDRGRVRARQSVFYRARLAYSQARVALTNFQERHLMEVTSDVLGVPPRPPPTSGATTVVAFGPASACSPASASTAAT